jgi:hypothetical protein
MGRGRNLETVLHQSRAQGFYIAEGYIENRKEFNVLNKVSTIAPHRKCVAFVLPIRDSSVSSISLRQTLCYAVLISFLVHL